MWYASFNSIEWFGLPFLFRGDMCMVVCSRRRKKVFVGHVLARIGEEWATVKDNHHDASNTMTAPER